MINAIIFNYDKLILIMFFIKGRRMLEYINILLGIISLVLIVLPIKKIASLMTSILTYIAPKNEKINKLKI